MGGKKAPKTEQQYFSLPLVDEKPRISDAHIEAFKQATRDYNALKKARSKDG